MGVSALKLANILSVLELLVLFIGGSIFATFMINTSLLILILGTVGWLIVIIIENAAITCQSRVFLYIIGGFRLLILTGFCVVPIILAPYYSQDSGP